MKRPEPLKHGECDGCLTFTGPLMPVGTAPGWPVIVWERLCLSCRLNMTRSKYAVMATDIQHSSRAETRSAYSDWLAAEA
jgi:hypothetical protein